ncbi:formylglycine-generating enzyme family protein [Vibrio tetraodonis]|uniref:formylglycine-generating enzyme family protein n=1 Tax=Vibrio tetraodonis TaxID=2231647 RepID=UPI000E09EAE0|nr:SUMF1/EgtB/PvdO family nonheme iron enzyme [Vibrio tetraodonis]
MKNRWLGLTCTLPLLIACNSGSSIQLFSETVSKQQIETIVSNIDARYPEATEEQKQKAAEAVVRAIENMVFVEGGSFDMGDFKMDCDFPTQTENRLDWSPDVECFNFATNLSGAQHLHKVTLDSYSISRYETSFLDMEWMRQINQLPPAMTYYISIIPMQAKPMKRTDDKYHNAMKYNLKHTRATYTKSWQEAKDYCQWLGDISGLAFDLPTEAQWEYAARSRGQHYYYATNDGYRSYAEGWYVDPITDKYVEILPSEVNSGIHDEEYIGQWPANPLGIYGMSNGISEWVNDWYEKDYYLNSPELNPQGPKHADKKVMRDGGGVKTFGRVGKELVFEHYSITDSFRCAVQSTKPIN